MESSEEVSQINSALTHCVQLKTHLQSTLLHIQRLNTKYNQTDYMAVIRNLDNYRRPTSIASSPYQKIQRPRDHSVHSVDEYDSDRCSTPVKRSQMFRRINGNGITSTPKRSKLSQLADSFSTSQSDFDTPKRSVRQMKSKTNEISVCKIKVQRDIEALITHLQFIQKSHLKRHQQQLEQSLYQSCCNSSFGSPGYHSHMQCLEQSNYSFKTAFGSNESFHSSYNTPRKFNASMQHDQDKRTLERVQRFYATPLQRMHKRLIHLNASLVSTC